MNEAGPGGRSAPQAAHLRFELEPRATLAAVAGQRRRFAGAVAALGAHKLSAPTRCEGWTVADVLRHGIWVDETMRAIWAGSRELVEGFDPRRTPDTFVRAERGVPDEEIRRRYLASAEAMASDLLAAGDDRFAQPSLAPVGEVPWWISAMHMGWDTAVHERDVLLPLGRPVEAERAETLAVLAYGLVIASFFVGADPLFVRVGTVRLRKADGPVVAWLGEADHGEADSRAIVVEGDPVTIVDAMSGRAPMDESLHGPPDVVRRLGGLARFFTGSR